MQLASIYASPGKLLLATVDAERVGCVGLRDLPGMQRDDESGYPLPGDPRVGEIRRLFVRSTERATGAGRALTERLIGDARSSGFDRLVLNTLPQMTAAQALYASLGFERCQPYVGEPLEDTFYLSLDL